MSLPKELICSGPLAALENGFVFLCLLSHIPEPQVLPFPFFGPHYFIYDKVNFSA